MKRTYAASLLPLLLVLMPAPIKAQRSFPVDAQVTLVSLGARRNQSFPTAGVTQTSGTISGVEGSLLGSSSGLGLFGRYLTGSAGGPNSKPWWEGGIALGDANFRLEFAYAERGDVSPDSAVAFLRGGFNLATYMGTSGAVARFRAGYYGALARFKEEKFKDVFGWEGETSLAYTWDKFPVSTSVGYRLGRLRNGAADSETSSLVLGVGLWFWSR